MWIKACICAIMLACTVRASTYTNISLLYSVSNWDGALDSSRVFLAVAGDSVPLSYTGPPGSNTYFSASLMSIFSGTAFPNTNVAVGGEYMYQIYPRVTNVLSARRPRILVLGSPQNDAVSYVNTPTQMWPDELTTNNLILAACKAVGTTLLYVEMTPRSTDYYSVATNWNYKLNEWAATNTDSVRVSPVWSFLKSTNDPAFFRPEYTFDDLHMTLLGQTNYDMITLTSIWNSVTITSTSPSYANVSNAYYLAKNGDTVWVPTGSNTWTSTLQVSKAIRLLGQGTNSTTVTPNGVPLVEFYTATNVNKDMVFGNFKITAGTNPPSSAVWKVTGCNTNNSYMIASDLLLVGLDSPSPFVLGAIGIKNNCVHTDMNIGITDYIYHENWNGKLYSAGSFGEAVVYGNDKWWVIENCRYNRTNSSYAFIDAYRGARYVVRYINGTNVWVEAHGSESGGVRGTRALESYMNTFYGNGVTDYGHNMRSGSGVIFSNLFLNLNGAANAMHLDAYRKTVLAIPWGEATGDNPIDSNDGVTYASGTATSGGTRTLTDNTKNWTTDQWVGYILARMTPLNSGYTLLTDFRSGYITGNTATTITVAPNIGGDFPDIVFAANDTYRLYKTLQIFDQPGAGKDNTEITYQKNTALSVSANVATATKSSHGLTTGDYIIIVDLYFAGDPDFGYVEAQVTVTDSSHYTFTYYHANASASANFEGYFYKVPVPYAQTLDPCYEWDNYKEGGVAVHFSSGATNLIRSGEHYYNSTQKPGYTPLAYPHPKTVWVSDFSTSIGAGDPAGGAPVVDGGAFSYGGKIIRAVK